MLICYKAAATGQSLIDGQEVREIKKKNKVREIKLPNLVSKTSNVGGECGDR